MIEIGPPESGRPRSPKESVQIRNSQTIDSCPERTRADRRARPRAAPHLSKLSESPWSPRRDFLSPARRTNQLPGEADSDPLPWETRWASALPRNPEVSNFFRWE